MRVKIKTASSTKVQTIDESRPFSEFLDEIREDKDFFPTTPTVLTIKKGFPPSAIQYDEGEPTRKYIANGDQLLVESDVKRDAGSNPSTSTPATNTANTTANKENEIPSVYVPQKGQWLILRNIPDDNSCMFNAIQYAMQQETVAQMRQLVAMAIESDPEKYNELVLGRSNKEYASWITKKDSWGGAIELGILSQYYNVRINCIDVESGNIIKFENEEGTVDRFINLIYSGIHYDILSCNTKLSTDAEHKKDDVSVWSTQDEKPIMAAAKEVCRLLQTRNYTTNTTKFRLRCLECYKVLVGEMGASNHANETGHFKFGEVN